MIKIEVNNKRSIKLVQTEDGDIRFERYNSYGLLESFEYITEGDFVTMLNWYTWQKNNGNEHLTFR